MDLQKLITDLCGYSDELEWFEFKENWFEPDALGEYVSALSNAAAFHHKGFAYFVWGINDKTHETVGTTFNRYSHYHQEPYQNYLARNLSPSINFSFEETNVNEKRIVRGSQATDNGYYLFTPEEKAQFLEKDPQAEPFFKRFMMGSVLSEALSCSGGHGSGPQPSFCHSRYTSPVITRVVPAPGFHSMPVSYRTKPENFRSAFVVASGSVVSRESVKAG